MPRGKAVALSRYQQYQALSFHSDVTKFVAPHAAPREAIGAKICASFSGSDRTYGARRIWRDLLAEGVSCDLYRIERLMRLQMDCRLHLRQER
jgi:transposase InsO family protein